ncbi:hypothetical protein [Micromonospora sp. b486]|nr:hypothetical protein [Micromonospora sp. b486]MDM4784445.1 hypothetical protein [Micromonospora sp. b486]
MTSTTPVTIDALKAARELAPTIADRAAEGERLGCVPPICWTGSPGPG